MSGPPDRRNRCGIVRAGDLSRIDRSDYGTGAPDARYPELTDRRSDDLHFA